MNRALTAGKALAMATAFVIFFLANWVRAQSPPDRAVHLVVGYPAGGSGDILVHAIAEKLSAEIGQPVVIDYRAGGSGAVGAKSVTRANPDGRVLLAGQTTEIVINRTLAAELGYDPSSDLVPVAFLASMPLALIVPANAPYSNVSQLLDAAKSAPRGLLFASPGPGTPGHLAGELLNKRANNKMVHVPYEGGSAALDAVVGNRVDFHFQALPTAMPQVRAGKLKILAVSSAKRSAAVPEVPTIAEALDLRSFDVSLWGGIFAPRNTPREIVERLNQQINAVLKQASVKESLEKSGAVVTPLSRDEFATFLKAETSKYEELIRTEFCSRLMYGGCGSRGAINLLP